MDADLQSRLQQAVQEMETCLVRLQRVIKEMNDYTDTRRRTDTKTRELIDSWKSELETVYSKLGGQ